jgi:CheY-like chemotaxis protein
LNPLGKGAIFIVEDASDIQMLLRRFLEKRGYCVTCASHGKEALQKLGESAEPPDVILLDLMMPVMDGFEFRKAQISDPKLAQVPVVVMTADGNIESDNQRLQVAELVRKPFDAGSLLKIIDRLRAEAPIKQVTNAGAP